MTLIRNSLAIGAVAFIAYCIYFDRKRRSDPEFKAKLKQKRLIAKRSNERKNENEVPIFKDPTDMQEYFLQEVQISDQLLLAGKYEEAVVHLANATVVCNQKSEFLAVMHKTLPAPVFQMLYQQYQITSENYQKRFIQSGIIEAASKKSSNKQFDEIEIE